jgi:hypothetical protein
MQNVIAHLAQLFRNPPLCFGSLFHIPGCVLDQIQHPLKPSSHFWEIFDSFFQTLFPNGTSLNH